MTTELIETYLEDMVNVDLIILYEIDGDRFLQFRKFENHQILRKDREAESEIPEPFSGAKVLTPAELQRNSSGTPDKDKISKDKLITEHSSVKQPKKKSSTCLVGNKIDSKKGDNDVVWNTHAKLYQYVNELNEKGEKINTDGSKKFKILAYYAILGKQKIENKEQWNSFVKRNIRIVGRLVDQKWSCEKVCLTSFLLEAKDLSWSLESIEKWLPKLDSELGKQKPDEVGRYKDLMEKLESNLKTLSSKYGK